MCRKPDLHLNLSAFFARLRTNCGHANPISMRLSQCPQLSQSKTPRGGRKFVNGRAFRGGDCLPWLGWCALFGSACRALQGRVNCPYRAADVPPLLEKVPPFVPPHTPGFRHTSAHVCALLEATSHRGKEKGRTFLELCGLVCGARGRTQTLPRNPHECWVWFDFLQNVPPNVPPDCS